MSTVATAPALEQHPAYATLLDALYGGTISVRQGHALAALLVSLAVSANLLEGIAPEIYVGEPRRLLAYQLGIASAPIDALRRELDALQYPHSQPDEPRPRQAREAFERVATC